MRIAIFSDSYHPQVNGVVTSIVNLSENLADRGHQVFIIAPKYWGLKENNHPGIEIIRITSVAAAFYDGFRWTVPFSLQVYRQLKKKNIDIVHFMTPSIVALFGIKFARLQKLPVVGTYHTFISDPLYFKHLFKGPITITPETIWKFTNLFYNSADFVSAPTKEAVRIIQENGGETPMEAISNGIDTSLFDNSHWQEFKTKYRLGEQVILFIGRMAHEKSIPVLMDAFSQISTSLPDAQLLLVGDGPQLEEFSDYAGKLPGGERIIFTGSIPYKELIKSGVFQCAALFATPSETETQGITLLEAQANGLATVGVNKGGVIDLIEDGVNGFLVPPGDSDALARKISAIISDMELRKSLGKHAVTMVEVHQMKYVVDRWEAVYTDLVARNRSGELIRPEYLRLRKLLMVLRALKLNYRYLWDKWHRGVWPKLRS